MQKRVAPSQKKLSFTKEVYPLRRNENNTHVVTILCEDAQSSRQRKSGRGKSLLEPTGSYIS